MEDLNQAATPQGGGIKKYVIAIIVLIIVVLIGYYSMGSNEVPPIPEANRSPIEITVEYKQAPADWKEYKNDEYGISVRYPELFTEEAGEVEVPQMNTKLVGTRLVHTVNVESCANPVDRTTCSPKTEDISVGVFFMKKDFVEFRDMLIKQTPDAKLQGFIYNGRQGFMLGADIDGRGIFQYFIPIMKGDGVMIITRAYINEDVATRYKGVDGFIPFQRQTEIFTGIAEGIVLD